MKNENEIHGDVLRGHLETMILAVLEERPGHGFEILKRLEERGCELLKLREGTLYPALYRLEEAGLVAGQWEEGVTGRRGPKRCTYRITSSGRKALLKGRATWGRFVEVIGGIVMGGGVGALEIGVGPAPVGGTKGRDA